MTPENEDRRAELAAIAVELGQDVARLTAASATQSKALDKLTAEVEKKAWKTAVKIRWMIALVVLDLVLSGAMLAGFLKITDLVSDQEITRADISCPILSDLLGGYDPSTRVAGHDRDVYEHNKALERRAFHDLLHCETDLVSPRSDLVTTTPPK